MTVVNSSEAEPQTFLLWDPNKVGTPRAAAYWLWRTGPPRELEEFLWDGLRSGPDRPELLLELGRSRTDNRNYTRARHLHELAWRRWTLARGERSRPPNPAEREGLTTYCLVTPRRRKSAVR